MGAEAATLATPPHEKAPGRHRFDLAAHEGQVVSVTLERFDGLAARAWAWSQMARARAPMRRLGRIGFHKLMGTGGGAGFSTTPNLGVIAILSVWPDGASAAAARSAPVLARRRERAAESATIYLSCLSSRGRWAGAAPFEPGGEREDGWPVAALTRATVRPSMLARFWRRVPAISATIEAEAGVRLMIGMGEVPYLHQVTFSIWEDAEAMRRFSRESATHGEAVRRVSEEGWFSEQLFARFRVLGGEGSWHGRPAAALAGPVAALAGRGVGEGMVR